MGYGTEDGQCCNILYTSYIEGSFYAETRCCPNDYSLTNFLTPRGTVSACCETGSGYIEIYGEDSISLSCCNGAVYRRQDWGTSGYTQGCCPEGSSVSCAAKVGDVCLEQECCPEGELPVCGYWADEEAGCDGSSSCCPIERRTDLGNMAVCCPEGKVGYCSYMDEYVANVCDEGDCCAPDKISYGTGENGADECLE